MGHNRGRCPSFPTGLPGPEESSVVIQKVHDFLRTDSRFHAAQVVVKLLFVSAFGQDARSRIVVTTAAHFHFDQGILKQFLAPSLMRNDDVTYLQELLHSHSVFDERMVRSYETRKCMTKENLLDDCCLHQVWKISDRQIYGGVSQGGFKIDRFNDDRSDRCPGCLGGYSLNETR